MVKMLPRAQVLRQALGTQPAPVPTSQALLTFAEAQALLRLSRNCLYRYIRSNQLKSVKIGSRRLFRPADVEDFIERHQAEAAA